MKNYVSYYRVSTKKQGASGLGLDGQKKIIERYMSSIGSTIIDSYTAIAKCKDTGAILVVAVLDRLSREGFGILALLEKEGVDYVEADSPSDSSMMKEIKFVFAKEERSKIALNTKKALAIIKDKLGNGEKHYSKSGNRVRKLGNPENLTKLSRQNSIISRKQKAYYDNLKAGMFIVSLRASSMNFSEIKAKVNGLGYRTSRNNLFSTTQIINLYNRYYEQ